jgi:hypothetical protein
MAAMIRGCGGRFIKKDESTDEWIGVGNACAREKCSHKLRFAQRPHPDYASRSVVSCPNTRHFKYYVFESYGCMQANSSSFTY